MEEPLYAFKRDLDMVTEDVLWLKKSYGLLDYIAKVVRNCELEQLAQAAQMRRIDDRLDGIEERMGKIEERLDKIEHTLALITKHLGIR